MIPLNIAIIGAGARGRALADACLAIEGLNISAVCDIWSYNRNKMIDHLRRGGHEAEGFATCRELLNSDESLDACIIATPDYFHSKHAIAAMNMNLDVYCETPMADSVAHGKQMIDAAKKTGRVLQIGYQRRSNPRYIHTIETLTKEYNAVGRITHLRGNWCRAGIRKRKWGAKSEVEAEALARQQYDSMDQLRNWRNYRKYGLGLLGETPSHQFDVFSWLIDGEPVSVTASGGVDYYKGRQQNDNVMCIIDYKTPKGTVRAFSQALTTTSHGGHYELFHGEDGTIEISENPIHADSYRTEKHASRYSALLFVNAIKEPYVEAPELHSRLRLPLFSGVARYNTFVDRENRRRVQGWVGPTRCCRRCNYSNVYPLLKQPKHHLFRPHLQNFFDAIRKKTPLACPGHVALKALKTAEACNKSIQTGKRITIKS